MKVFLICLMLLIGVVLTLHLSMLAQIGAIVKNPKMSNALFWVIGACTAVIIGFTDWDPAFFANLKQVPVWLFAAGIFGACLVFGIAYTIPRLGAGPAIILMIAGQMITGMIFSHFGWLGSPVDPITLTKVGGAVLLIAGALVVTFS